MQLSQRRESTSEEAKLLHSEQDFSLRPALTVCAETVKDPALSLRDQTLSLWSGSTDSKILDYQRTNPQVSSVQSLSCVQLIVTPRTAAGQASLSITNSWSLLKLMSVESVMTSNHLILCRPLLLLPSIFPSIRVFSNESALHIRWPKYWSFSFSVSPSNEYSGLISFRMD